MKNISILSLLLAVAVSISGQLTLNTDFNGGVTEGNSVSYVSAIQSDGKILVGGNFDFANGVSKRRLARFNPDGALDTAFNPGGVGPNGSVFEIRVLADGRLLIGGAFTSYNGTTIRGVARLNSDGTLDTSFNVGGIGTAGTVQSITLQADGKYLLSGTQLSSYNGVTKFSVIRINPNGTLDESFTSPFATAVFVEQTAIQADEKIVIGGQFFVNNYRNVARLNTDGTFDTSFAPITFDGGVYAMFVDFDNKILMGGDFRNVNGISRPGLARLNGDGSMDLTFDPLLPQGGLHNPIVEYLAFRSDGKIIVAGTFYGPGEIFSILQLNPDGTPDQSFVPPRSDNGGYHVAIIPDDKILLVGYFDDVEAPATGRQNIVRLHPNGTIDNTFNGGLSAIAGVAALLEQADGKIVVAGDYYRANGSPHRSLVRFNADGSVDESFQSGWGFYPSYYTGYLYENPVNFYLSLAQQPDGKILLWDVPFWPIDTYNLSYGSGIHRINSDGSPDQTFNLPAAVRGGLIYDVLVQPDGKILVGGYGLGVAGPPIIYRMLVRLNSDGTLDPTFTSGTTSSTSSSTYVRKILRQPDGKLIVIGTFFNYLGSGRNGAVRLNENGTIDTSFSANGGNWRAVALQSDGKILIAGNSFIMRWNSDGTTDNTFTPGAGPNGIVTSIVVQPDDKIVIGGMFTTYNGISANKLARLNPDGSLDTSVTSGLDTNPNNIVTSVVPTADGQILIGGVFADYGGVPRNNIAKLKIDAPTGAAFDYDGDDRSDISVFRPSDGNWYLQRSTDGFYGVSFGVGTDRIVPADYDGDGKTDVAVYRPSTGIWYVVNSSDGTFSYYGFGIEEDLPAPADYDGDGKADIAVFRPSTGTWYRQNSSDGSFTIVQFGTNGDQPTIGDFDGDGKADVAVFRPSSGVWYQLNSSDGSFFGEQFGIATDKITPADYDGDGKTDIAIYRPEQGLWYVKNSATSSYTPYIFGLAEDIPVPGDYDGDGKSDIAVFRPSNGHWYIANSSNSSFTIFQWGQNGDRPTPSAFGNGVNH